MISGWALVERLPIAAYAFRILGSEFVLEAINPAAHDRNPGLAGLCGKPMAALYSDQPQVAEDARRCAMEQAVVDRVLPVRRYDRVEATQNLRLTFVPAPPDHVFLFLQDVEDPDVARTAVMESEARYRSLVASLPDGVLLRGADGRVVFCNELVVSWFGAASEAALLGETNVLAPGFVLRNESGELVDGNEQPSLWALRTGQAVAGRVYSLTANDATKRWLRIAAQPILSASGAITGSVATVTDITALVQAEWASRENAARLDLALIAGRLGVWEFEPATQVGWWSKNLDTFFKIEGRPRGIAAFLAFVHPDDRGNLLARSDALTNAQSDDTFEQEFRIVGSDRVTRWARLRGQLRITPERRYVLGTVMDITEQRAMEEELRRSSRLESIGRLAGGIAHDFNNLLAAILGSLDLIEQDSTLPIEEDLRTIRHAALRARDLTKQLLAFARKQPVEQKTIDLGTLVAGIEPIIKRLVGPQIDISVQCATQVAVRADPALLEQVLVNLAVNARDAMPKGGKLTLTLTRESSDPQIGEGQPVASLLVADSGVGMDEETQRSAFDPFFTTKATGTGLGLATCYGIIQQHGGRIDIQSQPGHGTSFRVVLPCCDNHEPTASARPPAMPARRASGLILVVDDEQVVRATTAKMVRSLGYDVVTATNAAEAIEQFERSRAAVSCILCDIAMPDRDGPSLVTELRQRRPDLAVLFMSGYLAQGKEPPLPDTAFLQKPFRRAELAEKLRVILEQGSPP